MNNRGARPELELDQEAGSCYAEDRDLDASFNQIVTKLLQCATTVSGACDYSREFNTLFRQLKAFIATDLSERRRQDFSLILTEAYTLYCQLYYLHHCAQDPKFYASYAAKVGEVLAKTVDHSFTPEYRKIQITLGLVDVLCELFVQEVQVFGHQVDFHPSCRTIRRAIGNALINLTYRHRDSKQKLCLHPAFLKFVTGTIAEVPSLAQYYAGLVRNLSWNADEEMAGALRLAVPALVAAAMQVCEGGEDKCLLAVLSALWNLASHSVDNKKTMCETRGFLKMLILLLVDNPRDTLLVESASGILKYLCSHIKEQSHLLKYVLQQGILTRLIVLLNSSTFTVVLNALGALCFLAEHNQPVHYQLLYNQPAMLRLNQLRNSTREDISSAVKGLLNSLHNGAASLPPFPTPGRTTRSHYGGAPSCSGPSSHNYMYSRRQVSNPPSQSFLLTAPSVQTLPRSLHLYKDEHCYPQEECGNQAVSMEEPHRSLSLPRHMAGENAGDISSTWQEKNAINGEEQYAQYISEPSLEAGNDLTESMQATRSGSVESLNLNMTDVRNSTEYPSTLASAVNSGMESPASESELLLELPDSPSQCATHLPFALSNLAVNISSSTSGEGQGTLKRETTGDEQHKLDDDDTNTKEGIYGFEEGVDQETTGKVDDAFISNMIQMVLPKPSSRLQPPTNLLINQTTPTKKVERDQLLNDSIAAVMPGRCQPPNSSPATSVSPRKHHNSSNSSTAAPTAVHLNVTPNCSFGGMDIDWDENSRLEESPGKPAAPSSSNSSQVTTKNWRAEVDGVTEQPLKGPQIASSDSSFYEAMKNSSLLESPKTKERIRDAARLQQRNTMSMSSSGGGCGGNSSSGDNYSEHEQEDVLALVDASLPEDLAKELEAEQLVLDCKRIGTPKRKNHSTAGVSSKRSLNGSSTTSSGIPRKTTPRKSSAECSTSKTSSITDSCQSKDGLSNKTGNLPCPKPGVESRRTAPPPVAPKPANLIGTAGSKRLSTPTKSARVSPFNYRQPVEETEPTVAKVEENKKSSKSATTISKERLFVTTV